MTLTISKRPKDTLFADSWNDLWKESSRAVFMVAATNRHFSVSHNSRRVLEALMRQPVACASRCRISAQVQLLRAKGLVIETIRVTNPDGSYYGVYKLKTDVLRTG